ncbi:MAG: multidrug ABC transporter ATP-binding protein [Cyclobacteriaceae bacterium]|nr:MAG: multidrug ABC transporter ATP-binding protein [Cyclobacteriaceae bacterium]
MDIRIENLSKRYGMQKAVDGISFEVKTGEIVGFLGPNGAGKSTTMKMITGYLGIGEGDIFIGNRSVRQEGDELKKHIGYLPENNPLYTDMPVIDYLSFCADLQGLPHEKKSGRIKEMIQVTGLQAEKHKKIGELSKGYRQRVGLAQAMIHDPEILILDEPTTGLDPNQIVEIRKLIKELGRQKTVILSTHILPEVEATCDRILIINKGKIVANGTAESLRNQSSGNTVMRALIEGADAGTVKNALLQLPGILQVLPVDGHPGRLEVTAAPGHALGRALFNCCVQNGWVLAEAVPVETRLEDIFRNLTLN